MEQERIFNLQISIQRLEEELSLYRNGTTAAQIFDLIKEKDIEIDDIKEKLAQKEEKLHKLAKTSSDVLIKHEELLSQNQKVMDEFEAVKRQMKDDGQKLKFQQAEIDMMREKIARLNEQLTAEHAAKNELSSLNDDHKSHIEDLESELRLKQEEMDENIQELSNIMLQKEAQLEELNIKDQDIVTIKNQLDNADMRIENLQKRCAVLVSEKATKVLALDGERQEMIQQVQEFKHAMAANLTQRDEVILKKNDRIKELKLQLSIAQQDAKMKAQKFEEVTRERDAIWREKVDVSTVQSRLEEQRRKVEQLEAQKHMWNETRAEHESTKSKLMQLEEKLYRQEQLLKKRGVLADRTNSSSNNADFYEQYPSNDARKSANCSAAIYPSTRTNEEGGSRSTKLRYTKSDLNSHRTNSTNSLVGVGPEERHRHNYNKDSYPTGQATFNNMRDNSHGSFL